MQYCEIGIADDGKHKVFVFIAKTSWCWRKSKDQTGREREKKEGGGVTGWRCRWGGVML